MTLTASSVLHYWSSRYGINPVIGGRPVFSRSTAGLFTAQSGEVDSAIINSPRQDWMTLNLPNSLTERRKLLTLELARTNSILFASDFSNAAWAKTTMTVTTGIADPAGGTSACTLTATGANSLCDQSLAAGSSIVRTNSLWMRRRTGSGTVRLFLASGAGAGRSAALTLTSDWQRVSAVGTADTSRYHGVDITTSGDAVDVWLAQQDDGPFATAGIQTTTAPVTRATDSCYWNFPPVPQAVMMYVRFVEQGTVQLANSRLVSVGSSAGANPEFSIAVSGGFYQAYQNGAAISTLAVAPAFGDTARLVVLLQSGGNVQIIQSINGAAVTASTLSGASALPVAWSDTRLWLNSEGTFTPGASKFAEVKIVKYADVVASTSQGIMDELDGFELGPNGDVL